MTVSEPIVRVQQVEVFVVLAGDVVRNTTVADMAVVLELPQGLIGNRERPV